MHIRHRHPAPVLPAVAQLAAQTQAQQRQQPGQRAAVTVENDAEARMDDRYAGRARGSGRRFPRRTDLGQEAAPGRSRFIQQRLAAVAVKARR